MLTPNKKGKGRAISPLATETHASSYSNSVAHAPQHVGPNYSGPVLSIHINSAGGLESSATPSNFIGHADNPSSVPQSLPDARTQLQEIDNSLPIQVRQINNTRPTASPRSGIRPGTSSRSVKKKQRCWRIFQIILFFFISAIFLACICVAIMLIFNARESSS